MRFEPIPLVDGAVVLVSTAGSSAPGSQPEAARDGSTGNSETGLLDASEVATEVARVLGEGVAGGLTFETLKALARRIVDRRRTPPVPADILEVRDAVIAYLTGSGYSDVRVSEAQKIVGQGWSIEGRADSRRFSARAEESGVIIHVRVH